MPYRFNDPRLKGLRRVLRRQITEHKRILWGKLRGKQLGGFKFYRQYSVGNHVLDFYCSQKRIAIELDGGHHGEERVQQYDKERTEKLHKMGVTVLRFQNFDVKNNLAGILETILYRLEGE